MYKIVPVIQLVALCLFTRLSHAQTISPDHTNLNVGACPSYQITYTIGGFNSQCQLEISLLKGEYNSLSINNANKQITVDWKDFPQEAEISVKAKGGNNCTQAAIFKIPVISVAGRSPQILGCPGSLTIGKRETFELQAALYYDYYGNKDKIEVEEYQWEITNSNSGWDLSTTTLGSVLNKRALIVTDLQNAATIRVRGKSRCGKWSDWASCTIDRQVLAPCPIVGAPKYVVCEDTQSIGVLATVTPGLSGYTYHWTWPAGWNGNSSGSSGIVTPNGLNGGEIRLVAKAFGKTSNPCIAKIELETIEPSTEVIGDKFLCDDEPGLYTLNIPTPPGSTIRWEITPSQAATPSTGTGETAKLIATEDYSGQALLKYTIENQCGSKTRELPVFTGRPRIKNVTVDGKPGTFVYVCPSEGKRKHWINVELEGDADNCIDEWNDQGTTSTSHKACKEFDFTMIYNPKNFPPYDCAIIRAKASNECGETTQNIVVCPSYWACKDAIYQFEFAPNPASNLVNISLALKEGQNLQQVNFPYIEILDRQGVIMRRENVSDSSIQLDVSDLPTGLYYVRTWIEDGYVMDNLLIER